MKEVLKRILFTTTLFGLLTAFYACGSDDNNGPSLSKESYTVELNLEGNLDAYNKSLVVLGTSPSGGNANLIDDLGKELPTQALTDLNYTFKNNNTFTLDREVSVLGVALNVYKNYTDETGELKITMNIYNKGKLVKSLVETATETKGVDFNQYFQ